MSAAPARRPLSRSLRLYQHIAVTFVAAAFLLLLIVLYLSVSRATIRVVAAPRAVSVTADAQLVATPDAQGEIAGEVRQGTFTKERRFVLPEEGARAVEGRAGGVVTIRNTTGAAQPLVERTRLLSDSGVLFRIVEGVTVPARGQVTVEARADLPGLTGEIPATHFTIPGLNPTLQQGIDAISDAPMVGGIQYVRVLTQQDIDDAATTLREEIATEARTALAAPESATWTGEGMDLVVTTQTTDVPVNTEAGAFTLSLTAQVTIVRYDNDLVTAYARDLLADRVQSGFVLARVEDVGGGVTVRERDPAAGTALLSFSLSGTALLAADAPILAKDRFLGRSPQEVETLLRASDDVRSVRVSFTPFWLKRIPTLADHVEIIVEEE